MDITFEQGDERALAFIDTKDIIKHLENLGYQVVDKSEHGNFVNQTETEKLRSGAQNKKTTYFISVTKSHDDGTGSYSFWNLMTEFDGITTPLEAYNQMTEEASMCLKHAPGDLMQVIAFNKV